MTELITPRLKLRRADPDDLDGLHAVLSHPAAMRYWSTPPHTEIDQTRQWLESMITSPPEASDDFIVEHEGAVIGKAGCWRLPSIGYILHPDYWGRGLAREALTAVVAHVFSARDIAAITADVDPRNEGSLKLLARLGFAETHRAKRTWLVGDEWCDSIYLSLPRPPAPS